MIPAPPPAPGERGEECLPTASCASLDRNRGLRRSKSAWRSRDRWSSDNLHACWPPSSPRSDRGPARTAQGLPGAADRQARRTVLPHSSRSRSRTPLRVHTGDALGTAVRGCRASSDRHPPSVERDVRRNTGYHSPGIGIDRPLWSSALRIAGGTVRVLLPTSSTPPSPSCTIVTTLASQERRRDVSAETPRPPASTDCRDSDPDSDRDSDPDSAFSAAASRGPRPGSGPGRRPGMDSRRNRPRQTRLTSPLPGEPGLPAHTRRSTPSRPPAAARGSPTGRTAAYRRRPLRSARSGGTAIRLPRRARVRALPRLLD